MARLRYHSLWRPPPICAGGICGVWDAEPFLERHRCCVDIEEALNEARRRFYQ